MELFKNIFTFSNFLSVLRVLIGIPVFYYLDNIHTNPGSRLILLALFLAAAITDYLDGFFARKLNQITEFGKIIDPLADKLLVGIIVVKLFLINQIPPFYFYSVIGRDVLIFVGGIFVTRRIGRVLPSNLLGKITVTLIGLYLLGIVADLETTSALLYNFLYYSSLALVFVSLLGYIIRAKESLTWNKNESV